MPEVALSALSPTVTDTVWAAPKVPPPVAAVTVTVVAESSSATLDGLVVSVTVASSSSEIVTSAGVTCEFATPTSIVSLPSIRVSSVGVRLNVAVPLVSPAVIVRSKSSTAV